MAHAFSDVDAESDPLAWVGVLDRVGGDPLYAPYKRRIVELLAPEAGGRYLELGCGTGADAVALADRFGVGVTGVDRSRTMVAEARRRGVERAVVADAHRLPFASGSFDGAWADRTFQHLADPSVALGELARVVRRGGTVVVADPDYSTQSVAGPDPALAARVLAFRCGPPLSLLVLDRHHGGHARTGRARRRLSCDASRTPRREPPAGETASCRATCVGSC